MLDEFVTTASYKLMEAKYDDMVVRYEQKRREKMGLHHYYGQKMKELRAAKALIEQRLAAADRLHDATISCWTADMAKWAPGVDISELPEFQTVELNGS